MRIGIFSLAYDPFVGGAEIAVKELTARSSHNFVCFTHKFDESWPAIEKKENVEVLRFGKGVRGGEYYGHFLRKLLYIFQAWRAAERYHKEKPISAIWAVMASYAGFAALLFKFFHPRIPFILTLQEGDSEEHILRRVGFFYPIWSLIFEKADQIQVISNFLADFARKHGATCPIEVVPNGVDFNKSEIRNPKSGTNSKQKNSNTKVIITTSRLVHKNGLDTLIRAFSKSSINSQLLILGGGPEEKNLKNLSKELDVAERVQFLGHVAPEKIYDYLATADIFVRPSRSEGLGSSFLEAMAAGLPVIGTPVGGIPDFLRDKETGLFCRVDDPKDLAEKIDLLLNDKALQRKIIQNGKKLVEKNYSWDFLASKMQKIFVNLKPQSRLLIAAGIYPPDIGGPAFHVQQLAKSFRDRGFETRVISYGHPAESEVIGVPREIPFGLRHFVYFIKCFLAAWGVNLIYAQDATAAGFPAFLAAKIWGKKFYFRIGGDVLWERVVERGGRAIPLTKYYQSKLYLRDRPILYWLIKMVLKYSDKIIVTSELLKNLYSNYYGVPSEKISVIPNPVFARENSANFNAEPVFLFAGRFVAYKNLRLLASVFGKIRAKLKKGTLRLIGAGPDSLEADPQKGIEILTALPHDQLLEKIRSASVGLGPALTEFNPNFILECLSLGKPVLVSRENGLSVSLPEDFLFDAENAGELEAKLVKFYDPSFYKESLKKVAAVTMNQTWENVINEHLKIFKL